MSQDNSVYQHIAVAFHDAVQVDKAGAVNIVNMPGAHKAMSMFMAVAEYEETPILEIVKTEFGEQFVAVFEQLQSRFSGYKNTQDIYLTGELPTMDFTNSL